MIELVVENARAGCIFVQGPKGERRVGSATSAISPMVLGLAAN